MADQIKNQKEALAASIEMEKQGQAFYLKTAEKAKDKMTRDVFTFLSNEELKHIDSIKQFYEAEIAGKTVKFDAIIDDAKNDNAKKAINKLFSGLDKKAPVDKTDMEAYKFARDFEKNGEKFYREAVAKATNPQVKRLFEFLVEEELRHFQMIDDSIAFMENPSEWFHRKEKWHVEG
jgi:rubrerythrin